MTKHKKKKLKPPQHRCPSNQKYRKDPLVRPGARPPSTWDDLPLGDENWMPWKHVNKMLDKGYSEKEIVEKLSKKWKMSTHLARKTYREAVKWRS